MTLRALSLPVLLAAAVFAAGCGSDDDKASTTSTATTATANLGAIKSYLLSHTDRLETETQKLADDSQAYYDLAESHNFDYDKLLAEDRDEASKLITSMQATFRRANPAYEEMEGVVAGVPSLAEYDVTIDAGADGSDPENAVSFSLKTPAGKTYKQPGNFFALTETSLWGTEPKFVAAGVKPDLDGDGEVTFGEALPDADFLVTAAKDFHTTSEELVTSANEWTPTQSDVLTALVVMTPTMSEYFAAWKNSRFIAGSKAEEKGFVAASRLQDIGDILGGLNLIYANVRPVIEKADKAQAEQTGTALKELLAFVTRLQKEEAGGKKFTAGDADTLGSEAQDQAEAIAGQVTQVAEQLGIELQT